MTDRQLTDLRAEVARTLTPVTPLAAPGRRARVFLLLGAGGLALVPMAYGVRRDAATLGLSHLWLLSALQLGAAAALFRQALTESIPGRLAASGRLLALALALAAALVVGDHGGHVRRQPDLRAVPARRALPPHLLDAHGRSSACRRSRSRAG